MKVIFQHPILGEREFSQREAEKLESMPNGGWERIEKKENAAKSKRSTANNKKRKAGGKVNADTSD